MPDEQRRCYVTVLYRFDAYSDEDERCKREEIHGDAEDTAQRNNTFINHWETHDENMLAETETVKQPWPDWAQQVGESELEWQLRMNRLGQS